MGTAHAIAKVGFEGCASWRWVAKATELNRHTTRMKIRGSVVSLSFIFPHPPEDNPPPRPLPSQPRQKQTPTVLQEPVKVNFDRKLILLDYPVYYSNEKTTNTG